jgi:alkane 1-monooxygenase
MNRYWRYMIPAILTLIYIYVSVYAQFYYLYGILLVANLLNVYWGEFKNDELRDELKFFYRSSAAIWIKSVNAIVFLGLIVWGITFVERAGFSLPQLVAFSFTTGLLTGCFVVTLAHDLLHSKSAFQKGLSVLLLTCSGIPHFATEHLCGHHRDVGLREDPTTARINQSFYSYFVKITFSTIWSCYVTQFGLPSYLRRKIRVTNLGMLSLLLVCWLLIIVFTNNPIQTVFFFIVQGFVSYFLYELINYIQHYGLFRNGREDGITMRLSWNCYYKYTNYILFLLPLHSLHHLPANERKIQNFKEGPRMPYLYFIMITMALIPPLWFAKMNKRVLKYYPQ